MAFVFQELFHFQGGHAAAARRSNRLPVATVLHIAASVDSGNSGKDIIGSLQISVLVHLQLPCEHLRIWNVSDAQEHGASGMVPDLASLDVAQLQPEIDRAGESK